MLSSCAITLTSLLAVSSEPLPGRKHPSAASSDSHSVKTVEGGTHIGFDGGKKVTGRKRHLVVDTLGFVLAVRVTAAHGDDRPAAQQLFSTMMTTSWKRLKVIWADGNYTGDLVAGVKQACTWLLEIVHKPSGQKGFSVLPKRWIVERTFAWLNRQRRLSKDYERLPQTSEAFIYVAMIRLMLKRVDY